MPGDARLVGAIRGLAAHAAGYVHLSPDAAAGLAEEVARATEVAISATNSHDAPIDFRFASDGDSVTVTISCAAEDGSRHTSEVRQPISA